MPKSLFLRAIAIPVSGTVLLAALSACGGGSDSGGDTELATVSSLTYTPTRYGQSTTVTVLGTHLGNLSLTAPGCKNVSRQSGSNDTAATFTCTPSGAYTSTISAVSNATTVASTTLTVNPPVVTMVVSGAVSGSIVFNLRGDVAPITVDNFLAYVNSGFYSDLILHRVVAGYIVQGGGYGATTSGTLPTAKTTTYSPIALETTGGSNLQWTAAMMRTGSTSTATATSQFFFNLKDNSGTLDPSSSTAGYAVFADVSGSATVIQAIANLAGTSACTALLSDGVPLSDGSCVPIPNVKISAAVQTQ